MIGYDEITAGGERHDDGKGSQQGIRRERAHAAILRQTGAALPAERTAAGYRLYGEKELRRLQQILLFRELEFSLKEIKAILNDPGFDREAALENQIELLTLKKEHLENLLCFARGIQKKEANSMDFTAFDTRKMKAYAKEAKERWGKTDAYKAYEEKSAGRGEETEAALAQGLLELFEEFGKIKTEDPHSETAQRMVRRLQGYITAHYYPCTKEVLSSLGEMYLSDAFRENIDKAGGAGTAAFAAEAIGIYCAK